MKQNLYSWKVSYYNQLLGPRTQIVLTKGSKMEEVFEEFRNFCTASFEIHEVTYLGQVQLPKEEQM